MEQRILTIRQNRQLVPGVWEMELAGDVGAIRAPGQFVNIALPGRFLRRPISVCRWEAGSLSIIYKVVGEGTGDLSRMVPGQTLDTLVGLGNGFSTALCPGHVAVVGGGVGVPPMYGLAKALLAEGKTVHAVLGFNTAGEVFYEEEFRALGCAVTVTTVDGSRGVKGFVTDGLTAEDSYVCACGPLPMLKALYPRCRDGQFSFEERMGCGFGACMGCTCKTKNGSKRICKEGPVLRREEILWET